MKKFSYKALTKSLESAMCYADREPVAIEGKYDDYVLVNKKVFGFLKVVDDVRQREEQIQRQ